MVKYVYDAWGNVVTYAESGFETLANLNPFKYRSYYFDTETNLYYLKARYYEPTTGRFLNADDPSYLDPENLNGLNLFSYCGNNPIMAVDPSGCSGWNPFSWDWGKVGNIIASVVSVVATIAGAVLMFVPGAQVVGLGLMGFGVGSILGGHISMANGGTFAGGWLFGGLFGGTLGTVAGMALPAVTSFLGTSFSFAVPTLSLTGGGLAIGSTAISVSGSTLAKGIIGSLVFFAEHTSNKSPSKRNKHQNGQAQRQREKFGGEKGDQRREYKKWKRNISKIVLPIFGLFW